MIDVRDQLREWLRDSLAEKGYGAKSELARHLGVRPDVITRMLNEEPGKETRDIKGDELLRMADFFGKPAPAALTSTVEEPAVLRPNSPPPSYAGVVQAGAFLAVDEYFNQDPEAVPDYVLPEPHYPRVRQYAWRAKGDSMGEAGIGDGMWVVGADAADYIDQHGEIETGDLVVVERTRYQGGERELTVKEVRFYRDRYELHPRSKNPEYKPIVVPHNHAATGDEFEVKIIGVVLTAYANLRRRKQR